MMDASCIVGRRVKNEATGSVGIVRAVVYNAASGYFTFLVEKLPPGALTTRNGRLLTWGHENCSFVARKRTA
jgi:hypothetical protein